MPPSSKHAAASKDRRKSNTASAIITSSNPAANSLIITLKANPRKLRAIIDPDSIKEDSPVKETKESPATSTTLPAATNSNGENASDSTPNTPAPGTPAPPASTMGPPVDGPKKKGVKRSAAALANGTGEPKVRGKPGPKKKQKLEDGTIEGGRGAGLAAHKLGPKANQGAINAGLRALDRTGKPCRKWTKGNFVVKSFTGVVWEIPRWTAPPKLRPESSAEDSTPISAEDSSSKENKEDNSQAKSEASHNGVDVEMQSAPSMAAANSPAPFAIAAA
ncbi:INO80 complex, subunit Ies4 [Echria macrotheca]|uniref:INO80 complex, subunit Ies4 n=1 Tax=Echria macrotheca TaxID=438768 RepID=A0AAJ0B5K6_9PEZI|nr:INO80 complex, subunit Ies4 [Echria macrotheca]